MMTWKYSIRGLTNLYHVDDWPLMKHWMDICNSGDIIYMSKFHNTWIVDLNKKLKEESISKDSIKPYQYYNPSSFYKDIITLDYDPYIRFMSYSARESITDSAPDETIIWFSKNKSVEPKHVIYAINTLLAKRKLQRARFVLYLFPSLSFEEEARDIGSTIFRKVLMTNDIPLIHELWLRGALNGKHCYELCDNACEFGWVQPEAVEWYRLHRNREVKPKKPVLI